MLAAINVKARKNGFTLLEVLIAMAIFSLIGLASFTLFNTVFISDERSNAHQQRLNQLQRAFLLMERDFLQISRRTVRVNAEQPLSGYLHAGGSDDFSGDHVESLGFVRAGWQNPGLLLPRSELQSVVYRVEQGKLQRLHYNFVDVSLADEPKVRDLLVDVENIAFEFYYQQKWQTKPPSQDLPQAIAIELTLAEVGVIRRQFLVAGAADAEPSKGG